jgi:DNA-directed RNA polymerase specialized sigma24 family protein
MSPEDFAMFLGRFSPDRDTAGRHYIRLHHKLVCFFSMKGISDSTGAADETLRRAAERVCGGANVPDVEHYCLGIARNVAKEYWRRERREEVVFRGFIEGLANGSAEEVDRIEQVLKPCFERLKSKEQSLLVDYCSVPEGLSSAEHRRRLADEFRMTMRALRIRVSRLRDRLEECVKERLKNR